MTAAETAGGARLSVLVPSWNGLGLLPDCLASIFEALARSHLEAEVLVVDDGSTDGSPALVASRFPRVRVVALGRRGGFVRAVNRGMRECAGDWVLLANNDVRLEPDFFAGARAHFDSPGLFAIAPRIVTLEGGREIDESLYAPKLRFAKLDVVPPPAEHGGGPRRVYYASGAASFLRRALFLDMGGLDEIFSPYYWEDVDLSLRAFGLGLTIVHERACVARHLRSATIAREGDLRRLAVYFRNQEAFFWKHATGARLLATHAALFPLRFLRAAATGNLPLALGLALAIPLLPAALARRHGVAGGRAGAQAPLSAWIR